MAQIMDIMNFFIKIVKFYEHSYKGIKINYYLIKFVFILVLKIYNYRHYGMIQN